MKRRAIKIGALLAVLLACSSIAILVNASAQKDYVLKINGSAVCEEEFFLLLRQNTMQYENQLRNEYAIPDGQSVLAYLGGDESEYRLLLFQQNSSYITSLRIEQDLARKYGAAPEFTYEAFLKELDAENQCRADQIANGEAVYGLRNFTPEQYYGYYMSNMRTQLLRAIPDETLGVSAADAERYYRELDSFAHMDGERVHYTLCDVTGAQGLPEETQTALYRELAQALASGETDAVEADGRVFACGKRVFTTAELRELIGQSFDAEYLLSLDVGAVAGLLPLEGKSYLVRYDGFDKAEALTESEADIFTLRLKEQAYQALVTKRAECADVRINQEDMNRYTQEGSVP